VINIELCCDGIYGVDFSEHNSRLDSMGAASSQIGHNKNKYLLLQQSLSVLR